MSDDRDHAVLAAIRRGRNGQASTDTIAARLGYKPACDGRLAVSSTLRSLERRGLVWRIPPRDRWGHAVWSAQAAVTPTKEQP